MVALTAGNWHLEDQGRGDLVISKVAMATHSYSQSRSYKTYSQRGNDHDSVKYA